MKNKYSEIEIEIYDFSCEDIVRTSPQGEVDGDETKYPIPDGWAE